MSRDAKTEPDVSDQHANIRRQVRGFLASTFFVAASGDLDDQTSLLEAGIIDSTGVLEVIGFLEATFGFHVNDDEIVPDNLDTIDHIVTYVARKAATASSVPIQQPSEHTLMALVSVVITNYNYERYIGLSIESALGQTYRDLELIVVDDGSTDGSDAVISSFLSDRRMRYIKQANKGQAAATNVAIEASRGDYVAFLDADDIWIPEKLTEQMAAFRAQPGVGVVYSDAMAIDESGRQMDRMPAGARGGRALDELLLENFVPFSSAVVRRECFLTAGLLNPRFRVCTDYDLWLRIAKEHEFLRVPKVLIRYRRKANALSGNADEMFATARVITDEFIAQNGNLMTRGVRKREFILANYRRFSHYCSVGDRRKATAYLRQLLTRAPFSRYSLRAVLRILTRTGSGNDVTGH
jgi:glycosyltransferase involved in cell wall biosynthesis/acyl carrier protein